MRACPFIIILFISALLALLYLYEADSFCILQTHFYLPFTDPNYRESTPLFTALLDKFSTRRLYNITNLQQIKSAYWSSCLYYNNTLYMLTANLMNITDVMHNSILTIYSLNESDQLKMEWALEKEFKFDGEIRFVASKFGTIIVVNSTLAQEDINTSLCVITNAFGVHQIEDIHLNGGPLNSITIEENGSLLYSRERDSHSYHRMTRVNSSWIKTNILPTNQTKINEIHIASLGTQVLTIWQYNYGEHYKIAIINSTSNKTIVLVAIVIRIPATE